MTPVGGESVGLDHGRVRPCGVPYAVEVEIVSLRPDPIHASPIATRRRHARARLMRIR